MTVRPFVAYPHRILRTPALTVDRITDEVRAIWADMVETMDAMPGYGLAAPQIGIGLRLAVVDASEARGQAILMANPEVLHASGQMREHEEASPNLPGVSAVIARPRAVTVRFLNAAGRDRGARLREPLGDQRAAPDRPSCGKDLSSTTCRR